MATVYVMIGLYEGQIGEVAAYATPELAQAARPAETWSETSSDADIVREWEAMHGTEVIIECPVIERLEED